MQDVSLLSLESSPSSSFSLDVHHSHACHDNDNIDDDHGNNNNNNNSSIGHSGRCLRRRSSRLKDRSEQSSFLRVIAATATAAIILLVVAPIDVATLSSGPVTVNMKVVGLLVSSAYGSRQRRGGGGRWCSTYGLSPVNKRHYHSYYDGRPSSTVLAASSSSSKQTPADKTLPATRRRSATYNNDNGGVWRLRYQNEGYGLSGTDGAEKATTTRSTTTESQFLLPLFNIRKFWQKLLVSDNDTAVRTETDPSSIMKSILYEHRHRLLRLSSKLPIQTIDELRSAILDNQMTLRDTKILNYVHNRPNATTATTTNGYGLSSWSSPTTTSTTSTGTNSTTATKRTHERSCDGNRIENPFQDHAIYNLMAERYHSRSTPGRRHCCDNSTLALAIEGGGMRGCVSAGMAAAIAALDLTDTIDTVYGSSAGSVVGAYLVSRQVCMDVYLDILPAAKRRFVCKRRMARSIATSFVEVMLGGMRETPIFRQQLKHYPGMNTSFVIDGVMGQKGGIRPLDMTKFRMNNDLQPLKVVASCVDRQSGRLYSKTFGTSDFFDDTIVKKVDGSREGLFACLEASMTVPGATGPPVDIVDDKYPGRINQPLQQPKAESINNTVNDCRTSSQFFSCFDAFCFEPIPYRSAVKEGATHVLALCSRPEGYKLKTKPGLYESGVAPLYFHSHEHGNVAEFFEQGGQQYLYAEDILTLDQAKTASSDSDGVLIPPTEILYGVPRTEEVEETIANRESTWKRAHLWPIKVPQEEKELPTLEQEKSAVLQAVRGGFAAAFDSLSSIVGLDHIKGDSAARLLFPDDQELPDMIKSTGSAFSEDDMILQTKIDVPGEEILHNRQRNRNLPWPLLQHELRDPQSTDLDFGGRSKEQSAALLLSFPGFQEGRFRHLLSGSLRANSVLSDPTTTRPPSLGNFTT